MLSDVLEDSTLRVITLAVAVVLMVTMGVRQSLGLFISPLDSSTGIGITTISLAFAVAQLMWGVIQPIAGAVADRYGPAKILIAGLAFLASDDARWITGDSIHVDGGSKL